MPDNSSQFPYPYGSDLHSLWGWADRIDALLTDPESGPLNSRSWIVFRPCVSAADALTRLAVEHPQVARGIDADLRRVEERFADLLTEDTRDTRYALAEALGWLSHAILVAVAAVAAAGEPAAGDGGAIAWSQQDTPRRWAKRFGVSEKTFKRHCANGTIRHKKLSDRSYMVGQDDIPTDVG